MVNNKNPINFISEYKLDEIFTDEKSANALISLAKTFNIDAQIIGKVEAAAQKELVLSGSFGQEIFTH